MATVITITTIRTELIDALNMNTSTDSAYVAAVATAETYLTTAYLNRLIARQVIGQETTYNAEIRGDSFDAGAATPDMYQLYVASNRRYEYWLSPSFTSQTDVDYTVNASGSIEVTSAGTQDTRSTITVSAVPVNFALLMVDVLRIIGTQYSRTVAQSVGAVTTTPSTVRQELMKQGSFWANEHYLYMT